MLTKDNIAIIIYNLLEKSKCQVDKLIKEVYLLNNKYLITHIFCENIDIEYGGILYLTQ